MSSERKNQIIGGVAIAAILAYFFIPSFHNLVVNIFTILCVLGVISLFSGGKKHRGQHGGSAKRSMFQPSARDGISSAARPTAADQISDARDGISHPYRTGRDRRNGR